jgi:hypothetical protein
MDIVNLLFDHFFEVVIFLFLFGGSLGALLRWFVRHLFEHLERMQEKRNEELRLRIQLEQECKEEHGVKVPAQAVDSLPKDIPWDDRVQPGYQQQIQQEH